MFGLGGKNREVELELPFVVSILRDEYSGIKIEADGQVDLNKVTFYVCYQTKTYEMSDELFMLLTSKDVKLKVTVNTKKHKKFRFDLNALADAFENEDIRNLYLMKQGVIEE